MARRARVSRAWLESALFSAIGAIVRPLPPRSARNLLSRLARIAGRAGAARRRAAAARAVAAALDLDVEAPSVGALVDAAYQHLALSLFESWCLDREQARHPVDELVRWEGREHLVAAYASSQPIVLCSGRLGAFAALPRWLVAYHRPVWTVLTGIGGPWARGLPARARHAGRTAGQALRRPRAPDLRPA